MEPIFRDTYNLIQQRSLMNQSNDPNIGSSRDGSESTTQSALSDLGVKDSSTAGALLTTFVPSILLALFWISLFLICRRTQRRFYAPRSHLGSFHEEERAPELPSGHFNWIGAFFRIPDTCVLQRSSLDGYFFLRFLKIMAFICAVGCLIIWPILLPVHATGGADATELDKLSFSNVVDPKRYYAHVIMSWIFFAFVFCMVTRESIFYASLRQAYLLSPLYASRMSSRTVLFMSVPESYLTKSKLYTVFGKSVQRIWITTDCRKLDKLVEERDNLAYRLEEMETKFIKKANAARMKAEKRALTDQESAMSATPENADGQPDPASAPWAVSVKRPTHRRRYLFGEKIDTIEWLRSQLESHISEVDELQKKHRNGKAKVIPAVFVEFRTQTDAQVAFQTLSHHQPFTMSPRYVGIPPQQIIWPALRYSWWERIIRKFLIQGAITAMIIFWSIPSAFVGSVSNISYLTNLLTFLKFINDLPTVIVSVISGVLPAAGLALLMSIVPFILRFCAKQSGVPSTARVELFTQNAHFAFQVVQVFLVTTITSAASAATTQIIKDPLSAKDLLAKNLPKASNFYISYFLLQGLVLSAGAVVQVMGFLAYKIGRWLFDTTPRKLYKRYSALSGLRWGTVFPVFTNMTVIAITYSCIAPLILGFSAFGLYLVYQAYRYNLLFVYHIDVDTKGLIYPRALQQVLTGVYLAEVCLIGLFAIKGGFGPMILMLMFTIVTALAHISLNDALNPLLNALPRTLDKKNIGDEDADENPFLEKDEPESSKTSTMDEKCKPNLETDNLNEPNQTTATYNEVSPISRTSSGMSFAVSTFSKLRDHVMRVISRFLHPNIYADYDVLRKKVRQGMPIVYPDDVADKAYFPPSVTSPTPLLWIPRDPGGVSRQEVEETSRVIPITDEEAHLDERNEVVWDKEGMKPPIWEGHTKY